MGAPVSSNLDREIVLELIAALPKCSGGDHSKGFCKRTSLVVDDRDYYHESYFCLVHAQEHAYLDADGFMELGEPGTSFYAASWAVGFMRAVDAGIVPWQ